MQVGELAAYPNLSLTAHLDILLPVNTSLSHLHLIRLSPEDQCIYLDYGAALYFRPCGQHSSSHRL